jgi:hypothetical protein
MMTEGEQGDFVEQVERTASYDALRTTLLAAAADCDKRGHSKAVVQRFKAAAEVCGTAGKDPQRP